MTVMQLMTGSPNLAYDAVGTLAHVQSGALLTQLAAGTQIIGSVKAEITNASIDVNVTVADYVAIIGSPNYQLPVEITTADYISMVGSPNYQLPVAITTDDYVSVVGSPSYNLPVIGSVHITGGSVEVNVQVSDYLSIIGSPSYSLPVIGSVQVSSITGALPAGTSLLGSVKATPDGYYQVLGSPNYSLPVTGSVHRPVNTYNFGYIISDAGSLLFGSTTTPVNGEINRVVYTAANFTTGGSIWLQNLTNGVVENIGSVAANLNTSQVIYPAKALQNGTGASKVSVNGYVYYSGTGIGGPLSGQLAFDYR